MKQLNDEYLDELIELAELLAQKIKMIN